MTVLDLQTDIKPYLTITRPDNDNRLEAALTAAEALMAKKIGPLTSEPFTERLRGCRTEMTVSKFPIGSLTSVVGYSGQSVNVSLLELDPAGVLRYLSPWLSFWESSYVVTYEIGFDPLPEHAKRAIAALTQHLWGPQRGPSGGRGSVPDDTPLPFALPRFVEQMVSDLIPLGP